MSILITGGAGCIGGATVHALRAQGEDVVVVIDNLSRGHREVVPVEVPFYRGNVSNSDLISRIVQKHRVETWVHFAAYAYVGESVHSPYTYYDNRTAVRDYIHISDLASAHQKAVQYLRSGGPSEHFNLGTGIGYSVQEVIETAERVTKRRIPYKLEASRPGDPSHLVALAEKARLLREWEPTHSSLEEILKTAWEWMLVSASVAQGSHVLTSDR